MNPDRTAASVSRRTVVSGALAALAVTGAAQGTAQATTSPTREPWEPVAVPEQVPVTEYQVPVSGGGSLWCWDTGGDGEPVVLLHPGSGSGESWPYQQPVLAGAGFRVIGYSRRGAYGSVAGTRADADTASGDLDALADHLGLGRFHVDGSAAGGPLAIDYALAHGDRLLSLTVSGSIMGIQDAEYLALTSALQPDPFGDMPVEFKELGPSYRGGDPDGVAAWLEIHERARTADAFPQSLANTITWAALETIDLPVQLITGDADLYSPPSVMRLNARHLADVETHVVAEAGHNPHWEQPDAWNRLLIRFMRRHGRRS
ncbi:alpha/beta hydrolase [Streptomyces sp. S3(2020)]|uniref:alpha/beta fold hydrolase n=1 Tax=Streptomyces sp. S3(2020) TaxID=2732044 RepID=UPI0014876428|nr:alpha/beta hydrolase [Streptomyces sp. S3(2020)]NNN30078.1 alpha/beta hydrolase [Streptomyces sp. S3(2020)]